MPPFRVSPQDDREAFINLNKGGFTVRLTAQELEQMKSVDIGAVSPESLPDVSGMTFDNALSRKERVTSQGFCKLPKICTASTSAESV